MNGERALESSSRPGASDWRLSRRNIREARHEVATYMGGPEGRMVWEGLSREIAKRRAGSDDNAS
jgi:hypothetical protein